MPKKILSRSLKETRAAAAALAGELSPADRRGAAVVGLTGELGSGKTVFAKAFFRAAGVRGRVMSPTFILIRKHRISSGRFRTAYHVDLYRLKKPAEVFKIGFKEILAGPQNLVLIEWAERIGKRLPAGTVWVRLRHGREFNERLIKIGR